MNRVQFQPGLSMAEFMRRFGTQEQCEAALTLARWPQGFSSPTAAVRRARLFAARGGCTGSAALASTSAA
jgi:hypothetical protein